ncbi:Type 1 glutamine amidotransferase-like domain-containing protein [Pseudogracilibacillus sp. SE30717A]|uniref:Type 1 glutamine amidotransferase-like domain-containing protein n=1 Tax=Pseudogracilibacillus sp. SE30717A TaxID=3098293 RepID=UPI00300E1402
MKNRHLFLFGGSPPFSNNFGKKFADLALNENGKIAILFLERDGWKKYTHVIEQYDMKEFVYLPLNSKTENRTKKELTSCTGIIIGGGATELYQNYIVNTSIGGCIKQLYNQGVPVAGFSAGALISPFICVIPPIDNSKNRHLFLNGIGLINDCIISVHFSKWNEEKNLKTALEKVNVPIGYGIDDGTGLYFENESLSESEGGNFYTFKQ